MFPELADDSYATIGFRSSVDFRPCWCSGSFDCGGCDTGDHALLLDERCDESGEHDAHRCVMVRPEHGSQRFARCKRPRVHHAGDHCGQISGQINYQVFPLGVGADQVQVSVEFDGAGTFGGGGGGNACGCTNPSAVNYDDTAEYDDGSCE